MFSDYKENDGINIKPFIYTPLARETLSDDSPSDNRKDHDGSGSSDEDSARLCNTDW